VYNDCPARYALCLLAEDAPRRSSNLGKVLACANPELASLSVDLGSLYQLSDVGPVRNLTCLTVAVAFRHRPKESQENPLPRCSFIYLPGAKPKLFYDSRYRKKISESVWFRSKLRRDSALSGLTLGPSIVLEMRQIFLQAICLTLGSASALVTDEPFDLTTLIVSTSSTPRTEVTSIPITVTSIETSAFIYTSTACITLFQNDKKPSPLCPTDADESVITSLSYRTDVITTVTESNNVIWDPVTLTQPSTIQTHHPVAPSAAAGSSTDPSPAAPTQLPSTQVGQFTSVGSVATLSSYTESGPVQEGNGVFTMTSTRYVSAPAKSG
jgi:hypothetical protein